MAHHIRSGDRARSPSTKLRFFLFRLALYGLVGLAGEVIFYNVVKLGRLVPGVKALFQFGWHVDPRLGLGAIWDADPVALYGQASLWMMLVYAGATFGVIEPVYRRLWRRPAVLRAAVYGVGILVFEAVTGWVLYGITGYKIWFYDDALSIVGMTSVYILPMWMIIGLLVERVYRELMDPDLVRALESAVPEVPDFDVVSSR